VDVVTVSPKCNTISVLFGTGTGDFSLPLRVDLLLGGHPTIVVAADFDLDGYDDLAIAQTTSHSIATLRNLGNGKF